MDTTELHKQVDSEYSPLVDAVTKTTLGFWAAQDVFALWKYEKEYIDKHGCRLPRITNISMPSSLDEE